MDFEFLYEMLFNSYTIVLLIVSVVSIILLYEKASVKYLLQNIVVLGILCVTIKFIFLDYNIILIGIVTSIIMSCLFSIIEFGIKKQTLISIMSQIFETFFMCIMIIFIFMLRRRNAEYNEFGDTNIKMIFLCLSFISFVIFNKINIRIINVLNQCKIKTEDMDKKFLLKKGIECGKDFLISNLNMYICYYSVFSFLAIMYINNIYVDGFFINEIGVEIIVLSLISLMIINFSFLIPSYLCSIFNYRKEIYKKTSSNRVNGEKRTLKL